MNTGLPTRARISSSVSRWLRTCVILPLLLIVLQDVALSWVYPEHREIMLRAILKLDDRRMASLEKLWAEARKGRESRLTAAAADTSLRDHLTALDYASWPAIAGDHSCSSAEMLHNVVETAWILDVGGVGSKLQSALTIGALDRPPRTNAVRDADLRLLHVDPEYATRAGANNVHFLLARAASDTDVETYIETCLHAGSEGSRSFPPP
jgi:hypothetical protein